MQEHLNHPEFLHGSFKLGMHQGTDRDTVPWFVTENPKQFAMQVHPDLVDALAAEARVLHHV